MSAELTVENLTKIFRINRTNVIALQTIDFSIPASKFVSIVGPSGCGKSTLLRCIAGFEPLTSGSVSVDGIPVKQPGKDRMVVFQNFDQLFPWLTVLKNILYAIRVTRTASDRKTRLEIATRYLDLVGLADYRDYYPHQLSGGMKQRVAIARALAVRPRILLMDEPFGSLDALTRNVIQEELVGIWQKTQVTILFVTHSIEEALILSDEVIVFETKPGRIKAFVPNPLPRPRSPETPQFVELWRALNEYLGVRRQAEHPETPRRRLIFEDSELIQSYPDPV